MPGLYPAPVIVDRFLASVSAETLAQTFIAPCDLDVIGMLLSVSAAPGGSDGLTVNVSDNPVSQSPVAAYNLWTAANVPTISGTSTRSYTAGEITTVVQNSPYALDYPFPGPSGTVGYETAQSMSQITSDPVTSPPLIDKFGLLTGLVAPDNTYTDVNGFTLVPASHVHEGDILSFVIAAITSVGSAANLEIVLFANIY